MCAQFVIEFRSDSDRLGLSQEKMQRWLGYGAKLAWLIDPSRKTVEIYRSGQATEE